eukprot:766945-Prorocentrum_minimum.AAC.1
MVNYKAVVRLYDFYCASGAAEERTVLQKEGLQEFMEDMRIVDPESRGCTQVDAFYWLTTTYYESCSKRVVSNTSQQPRNDTARTN